MSAPRAYPGVRSEPCFPQQRRRPLWCSEDPARLQCAVDMLAPIERLQCRWRPGPHLRRVHARGHTSPPGAVQWRPSRRSGRPPPPQSRRRLRRLRSYLGPKEERWRDSGQTPSAMTVYQRPLHDWDQSRQARSLPGTITLIHSRSTRRLVPIGATDDKAGGIGLCASAKPPGSGCRRRTLSTAALLRTRFNLTRKILLIPVIKAARVIARSQVLAHALSAVDGVNQVLCLVVDKLPQRR